MLAGLILATCMYGAVQYGLRQDAEAASGTMRDYMIQSRPESRKVGSEEKNEWQTEYPLVRAGDAWTEHGSSCGRVTQIALASAD